MRKRFKLGRPSHATVVAYLALFVAIGGSAYAARQLPKSSVGTRQLKKNAVTTKKLRKNAVTRAKIRKNAVTGAEVNESTLGTVPTAQTAATASTANAADIANSLAPPEGWHEIGAPGQPGFQNSWANPQGEHTETAAFYKDHEGVVHLKGYVTGGSSPLVFVLPPGYRPGIDKALELPIACFGGPCTSTGRAIINGSDFPLGPDGGVIVQGESASLNGITFSAES